MIKRCFLIGLAPVLLLSFFVPTGARSEAALENREERPDIAALLDRLGKDAAGFQTLKTEFTQEKHLAVFQNTVVLKGRIVLQKPNRVAWHVDTPVKYSVVISDASVRQWDEDANQVQEISLAKNPVLQNVLHQLTVWFSGDYGALLKDFDVVVTRQSPPAFRFSPKKTNMAVKIIKDIEIEFRDDRKYLRSIAIHELGGDSTVITFTGTQFNVPLEGRDFEVKRRV